jgi:hypothetical protein
MAMKVERDYPVSKPLRGAGFLQICKATNQIQRMIIARRISSQVNRQCER